MMKSEEYKKYLKRIKRNNILVLLTQILIVVIFIVFWQIMADKNMVDTFLVSSPKKVFLFTKAVRISLPLSERSSVR